MSTSSAQTITFRAATIEDADIVTRLFRELTEELGPPENAVRLAPLIPGDIEKALESEDSAIFLAMDASSIIGFARADILSQDPIFRLRENQRCGYIDQMFVQKAYRKKDLGIQLLRLCEDFFRDKKLSFVLLHSAPKAARFYARAGYHANREMFKKL
ncbi:GNAT family N-acetyltransferase [Myxococcota bacterium]|nr:GNAT family N-acetyltransferase [Myxococcota bacterium]